MIEEIWKDIPGFEGKYQASTLGNIRSLDRIEKWSNWTRSRRGRTIKPRIDKYGYPCIVLCSKHYTVHRAIAITFLPPKGAAHTQVNHINCDKTDNRPENLEWCDAKINVRHSWANGLCKKRFGKDNYASTPVLAIKDMAIIEFESLQACGEYIGVSKQAIRQALINVRQSKGFSIYPA